MITHYPPLPCTLHLIVSQFQGEKIALMKFLILIFFLHLMFFQLHYIGISESDFPPNFYSITIIRTGKRPFHFNAMGNQGGQLLAIFLLKHSCYFEGTGIQNCVKHDHYWINSVENGSKKSALVYCQKIDPGKIFKAPEG